MGIFGSSVLLYLASNLTFFNFNFIYFTSRLQFPLNAPLLPTPLFLFRKWQDSQGYQPNMSYQVAIRLGTSPHIKAGQGNPVGGKGSQEQAKESETPPLPLLGVPQEHQATQHNIYAEDLGQT